MSDVHDAQRLMELQHLPLERKIQITQTRIIEFYQHYQGQVCISFSGGKDSTVLLHIARQLYPDIPAVFSNTGLEYPEIQRFVKSCENVDIVTPAMRFDEVVSTYGYPLIGKEVAEAIHYARRIRSRPGNVERERERTKAQKREELLSKRVTQRTAGRSSASLGERHPHTHTHTQLRNEQSSTELDQRNQPQAFRTQRKPIQANRGSEWEDWRRGCL